MVTIQSLEIKMDQIEAYLDKKRKNVLTTRQNNREARSKLYAQLRPRRDAEPNSAVEGDEQSISGDVQLDTKSTGKKHKRRKKGKRLSGSAAGVSGAAEKSRVQDGVHGFDGSVSAGISEQSTGRGVGQGDLLSKVTDSTKPTTED
jgi:hypothetical protein